MVRWCWVNFQCRGILLIWLIVEQGPTALAVGANGGCLDIFALIYLFSPLSPSLWETARYRLKYCLKGPLNSKQPTNQIKLHDGGSAFRLHDGSGIKLFVSWSESELKCMLLCLPSLKCFFLSNVPVALF